MGACVSKKSVALKAQKSSPPPNSPETAAIHRIASRSTDGRVEALPQPGTPALSNASTLDRADPSEHEDGSVAPKPIGVQSTGTDGALDASIDAAGELSKDAGAPGRAMTNSALMTGSARMDYYQRPSSANIRPSSPPPPRPRPLTNRKPTIPDISEEDRALIILVLVRSKGNLRAAECARFNDAQRYLHDGEKPSRTLHILRSRAEERAIITQAALHNRVPPAQKARMVEATSNILLDRMPDLTEMLGDWMADTDFFIEGPLAESSSDVSDEFLDGEGSTFTPAGSQSSLHTLVATQESSNSRTYEQEFQPPRARGGPQTSTSCEDTATNHDRDDRPRSVRVASRGRLSEGRGTLSRSGRRPQGSKETQSTGKD